MLVLLAHPFLFWQGTRENHGQFRTTSKRFWWEVEPYFINRHHMIRSLKGQPSDLVACYLPPVVFPETNKKTQLVILILMFYGLLIQGGGCITMLTLHETNARTMMVGFDDISFWGPAYSQVPRYFQGRLTTLTPWKFNIAPENRPYKKESSLPTIIFQASC